MHWQLTGQKVLGVGDAVGIFPTYSETKKSDGAALDQFDELISDKDYPWKLQDILPQILVARKSANELTGEGAKLLDPSTGDPPMSAKRGCRYGYGSYQ